MNNKRKMKKKIGLDNEEGVRVVIGSSFGINRSEIKSQLHYLQAVQNWSSYLQYPKSSFQNCKMWIIGTTE
jgi:hypothetical protein